MTLPFARYIYSMLSRGRTPEYVRAENLARYGLTVGDWEEMREAQEYRCAICRRHEDELPQRTGGRPRKDGSPAAKGMILSVDHDHETGAVRGLLCRGCNQVVGLIEDRAGRQMRKPPDLLESFLAYLSPSTR